MATQDRDEVTLIEAAGEIGISRGALYSRVQRAKRRGEPVPFRKSGKQGRLIARRNAFDTWAAGWASAATKTVMTAPTKSQETPQEPAMTREDTDIEIPSSLPSSSSGSAVGDPLAASAETVDSPAVTEPVPTVGAPVINDLPPSYMENRVTTLLHGPNRIAVYWDVHPETAKAHAGERWGILVRTANVETLIEIEHGARNWYIDLPGIGMAHEVTFGPIHDGAVQAIAHTELVPPPAPVGDAVWGEAGAVVDYDLRWGRQETTGETSLVGESPASSEASDGTTVAVGAVATVDTEELRRASSGAHGSASSGALSSPGLSRPGA